MVLETPARRAFSRCVCGAFDDGSSADTVEALLHRVRQLETLLAETHAALAKARGNLIGGNVYAQHGTEIEAPLRSESKRTKATSDATPQLATAAAALLPIVALDDRGCVAEWNDKAAEVFFCPAAEALGQKFSTSFVAQCDREAFEMSLARITGRSASSCSPRPSVDKSVRSAPDGVESDVASVTDSVAEAWRVPSSVSLRSFEIPRETSIGGSWTSNKPEDSMSESEGEVTQLCDDSSGCMSVQFRNASRSKGDAWHYIIFEISSTTKTPGLTRCRGGVASCLAIGRDVTTATRERVKLERERLKAERVAQDLTRLLQTVNVSIISVDDNGMVTGWNEKAERLTGYSRDEALGQHFVSKFIHEEFADALRFLMQEAFEGNENMNHELSLFTKANQRREILLSATTRRNDAGNATSVLLVAQDITYLRSESKMLANYLQICGAAVWSLSGDVSTGTVLQRKTKDIEQLMSQQAKMDQSDPRMVLWRTSFVSILNVMCRNLWESSRSAAPCGTIPTTSFEYEFCFEAANGGVKWYKVQGHLTETVNRRNHNEFEVIGLLHDVTSMFIQKVIGDAWQKWWSRMCLMVFDATLLVDTQEYRVLNAWGEEKVFGCKLQSNYPILQLIKPEDFESLKRAFSEATLQGSERGRTLHLLRQGGDRKEMPAKCFLLGGEQENVNECMMGIRMQVALDKQLWDVAKPSSVLTLDDLARLSSGLKRGHRSPCRPRAPAARKTSGKGGAASGARSQAKSQSLMSIPEDLHGESEDSDLESISARSSKSDTAEEHDYSESSDGSDVGVCNSARSNCASLSEGALRFREQKSGPTLSPKIGTPLPRTEPLNVKLKWARRTFDLNLDNFESVTTLREHVQELTGVPTDRQTLILTGRRLPLGYEDSDMSWAELISKAKPGTALMMIGSAGNPWKADRPNRAAPAGRAEESAATPAAATAAECEPTCQAQSSTDAPGDATT